MRQFRVRQKAKTGMCVLVTACMLAGCGNTQENINLNKGMGQLEQLDYNSALESFEAALVYNEDNQLLYRGEGLAYMGLSDYESAVQCFLKSISYAEGHVTDLEFDTNYYLAAAYYKLGKYDDAEKIYTAIIGLRDKETDAYYLRACTLLKKNNYEEAVKDFEKAFTLEPDNLQLVTDAYVEMQAAGFEDEGKTYVEDFMQKKDKTLTDSERGTLYYYLEDYENARTYLDGALNSGDAQVILLLGQTYEKLGDMNYAAVVYKTYLDSNEPDAAIYNSLGACLMKQEKYQDALDAFEAGIDIGNSAYMQKLKFNKVVATEYLGDFEKAKQLLNDYLAAYPDDSNAKREAKFLETR